METTYIYAVILNKLEIVVDKNDQIKDILTDMKHFGFYYQLNDAKKMFVQMKELYLGNAEVSYRDFEIIETDETLVIRDELLNITLALKKYEIQ
ncbi:MAG: hypothetical protein ACRDAO_06820 [Culicoidibacterales bacterium]